MPAYIKKQPTFLQQERVEQSLGWLAFLAALAWFYRNPLWMWATHLPGSGDVLEALWQTDFWRNAALSGAFQPVSQEAMYPVGMHQMVLAHAGAGLLLLPVALVANSAVAVNLGFVGGLILSFLGARAFLKHFTPSPLLASIGAVVFAFGLGRTLHVHFHLNVALASTASVWMAALLIELRQRSDERHVWRWAVGSGVCWGISVIAQPYFAFLNAVLMLLLGRQRAAWRYALLIPAGALTICGPFLLLVTQGSAYMGLLPPGLEALRVFSATPGSYLGWGRLTAWESLAGLSTAWRRMLSEADMQNWGVIAPVLAIAGALHIWRAKSRRAVIVVLATAGALSMGPVWLIDSSAEPIRLVNDAIWQLGSSLKPGVFDDSTLRLKKNSLPLPGMLPVLLAPGYEFARVAGRYSILVGLAAITLAIATLNRLPRAWAVALGCLLALEMLPKPRQPSPFPQTPHPAHVWAAQQIAGQDRAVYSPPGMLSIYSHHLAGNLAGANVNGPFAPAYTLSGYPWITFANPSIDPPEIALTDPTYAAILRRAQVGIVLLRPAAAEMAQKNSALRFAQCFEPAPSQRSYYQDTLCAFEVLPNPDDFFTVQPLAGFSSFEPRQVWVEGKLARAGWRISHPRAHTIEISMRAYCPDTKKQSVVVKLNGQPITSHEWSNNCWDAWHAVIGVSPDQLRPGLNSIEVEADSAAQPYLHDPASTDRRALSVLIERLRVLPTDAAQSTRS